MKRGVRSLLPGERADLGKPAERVAGEVKKKAEGEIGKEAIKVPEESSEGEIKGELKSSQLLEKDVKKPSLLPLLSVNFIGTLGFSIVLPFLVFLVERLGGNAFVYGLISSMYPACQLVGGPLLGRWSDIYGRKKVLLLSQLGTLFSWIIFLAALFLPAFVLLQVDSDLVGSFVFTLPLAVLFFARALDGLTGGNVSVANAYLADITPEKDRNRSFGRMAISTNLGFIIGPALAGLLSVTEYGEALPVFGAVLISLLGVYLIVVYLPESKECAFGLAERGKTPLPEGQNVRKIFGYQLRECRNSSEVEALGFKELLKLPFLSYMFGLYFLIFFGFNLFYTAFPLHAIARLDWSIVDMGLYFTVLSSLLVFVQGPGLLRASKRYSEANLVIFGCFLLGTNFLLLIPGNLFLIYLAAGFFAVGDGLMWPSFLSLLSKFAGKDSQGTVQGFASSFGGLASISGLILGGFFYGQLGANTFLIASFIIYFVFLLSFRLLRFEKDLRI